MGRYQQSSRMMTSKTKDTSVHPIWRGIGCILIMISPIIAYAGATFIVEWNIEYNWYPLPEEFMAPFNFEPLNLSQEHFFANLLIAGLLLLLGFALVMVVYTILYAILGPRRYSPVDSPPLRRKS